MTEDSVRFMDVLKGQRIKLTLKTSSYFGVIQRINPNKTLLLADVINAENGRKLPGVKLFFGHDVVNENDRDDEEFINFVVIDEFYDKFGPAVMHIKNQQVIGVGAVGVGPFQHGRLCWLQIATRYKVYLFDILLLGDKAFKNGLAMILESKFILKVLHDCRGVAGCLIDQFGVQLKNVFDTQVADVMFFYSETGGFLPDRLSTLPEVVSLHLKMPSFRLSSLQFKSQLSKEDQEIWFIRPCPSPLLKVMALSVIHLKPLRLVLLDTLMTDYVGLVDSFLNSTHKEPDDVQHISMSSVLELPREIRELERMRRERQEWATGRYPVTEQGLLVRSKPRHQHQTSPPAEERIPVRQIQPNPPKPATVEPLSPAHVDPFYQQPSTTPPWVTDVSSVQSTGLNPAAVRHSPNPVARGPILADVSDLRKQLSLNSPESPAAGLGLRELVMDMGRGRLLEKHQQPSFPSFPCIGRGFSLQIPPAQVPKALLGDTKTPGRMEMAPPSLSSSPAREVMPQPGPNALHGNIAGLGGGSVISQSFHSFRKT
ncbi:piRNA biogenesis protein EXD1 [Diretmus argenteus]